MSQNIREGICTNCTVLTGRATVTFENGKVAGINVSKTPNPSKHLDNKSADY